MGGGGDGRVRRFFDGGMPPRDGLPGSPPDRDSDPRIVLNRVYDGGREEFTLQRRIGYLDRELGELLVPADPDDFRSDLTTVPWLFTWLVPKTGRHLPPALLHDGLVHPPGTPPTYVSTEGHDVSRVEADRVFRDAMRDNGTGLVRRWFVWAAVTTVTITLGRGTGWPAPRLWKYRLIVGVTTLLMAWLSWCATWDLVDRTPPLTVMLPWMGERPLAEELVGGFCGAITVPILLGLTWGRFRMAGIVMGVFFPVLLHVTAALALLTGFYKVTEAMARHVPRLAAVAMVVVLLACSVGTVLFSL